MYKEKGVPNLPGIIELFTGSGVNIFGCPAG